MWKPPNPIRHSLAGETWPTREQASAALWFQPICIGKIRLEQRTWVPAMVPWRATQEGYVTQDILDWYGRFARGQPGAIVVEATGIRDIPSGPLLRVGHDRFLPGLEKLVQTVKRESQDKTRLFLQMIDFLAVKRRPSKEKYFAQFFTPRPEHRKRICELTGQDSWFAADALEIQKFLSAADDTVHERVLDERELESLRYGYRERVTDMDLSHIRNLPKELPVTFACAAKRAQQAGFDGVELHYAHAYTMAAFLSAKNTREDGYGGIRENRVRLPLEVYQAVRQQVGSDYVVGVRYLGDEVIEGGSRLEDAIWFGKAFAKVGMDYLSISKGGKFEDAKQPQEGWAVYPYTGQSGYECMPSIWSDQQGPFGRNVPLAAAIRKAVRSLGLNTPIITSGGIASFALAEHILQQGQADIVAGARQSLADPDWFLKIRLGQGPAVRRCEFTNYCEGLDQKHKQVTCKLWDRVMLDEPGTPISLDGKRRLIAPEWKPNSKRFKV